MKLVQADNRGFVMVFSLKGREYLLIYTKAGCYRGGHSHEAKQLNTLLSGSIMWNDTFYSNVFSIETEPNVYHRMLSITDSLMVEVKG